MRPVVRRTWWVLALALVLFARPALACKCSDGRSRHEGLIRPLWPTESGLVLTSESIDIDCSAGESCRWRSTHVYERASPGAPARVPFVLPLASAGEWQLRFGEQVIDYPDAEARAEAEALITEHLGGFEAAGNFFWLEDDGTRTRVELVIEGDVFPDYGRFLDPHWYARGCCDFTALDVRHPFVPTYTEHRRFDWRDPDASTVSPNAKTHLRVRPLPKHQMRVDPDTSTIHNGDAYALSGDSKPGIGFSMIRRRRIKGGPFIAFGGAILDANPGRGRIGWEGTFRIPFVFYSAALETDFQSELTVVPAIEISHGRSVLWWMLPCAGLGVGLPVQFLPDPRPAFRVQASLSWRVFSFLTTFDYLMPLRPTDAGVERPKMMKLAFLGQFSF